MVCSCDISRDLFIPPFHRAFVVRLLPSSTVIPSFETWTSNEPHFLFFGVPRRKLCIAGIFFLSCQHLCTWIQQNIFSIINQKFWAARSKTVQRPDREKSGCLQLGYQLTISMVSSLATANPSCILILNEWAANYRVKMQKEDDTDNRLFILSWSLESHYILLPV